MSKTQRLVMLGLAAVVAVAAVIVLQTGGNDEREAEPQQSVATATPTSMTTGDDQPEAKKKAKPKPTPTSKPVPLLRSGRVTELEFKQGDRVAFAARADEDEEIHVHGYDISKEAPAGKTVEMSFKADITGIFEIEFEHAGEPIAELKVEP